ncbi:MAG: HD domain-containing protein [Armatimonadota bacterium]|nr:HD domain-containing protein [Armatimonadota bacterium]
MSSSELGPYVLTAVSWIICLAAVAAAVVISRRSVRERSRWVQVAAAADLNRSLNQTGDAILTLLSAEVSAASWSIYRYDQRRANFQLVSTQEDTSSAGGARPQLTTRDGGNAAPETPSSLSSETGSRSLGLYPEHGYHILSLPLPGGDQLAGIARAVAVAPGDFSRAESTLRDLQEPLGRLLRAANERELDRYRLVDLDAQSQVREALLQSTFSAHRLVENTLGVIALSTQSSGSFVRLDFANFEGDTNGGSAGMQSFAAGDVKEILAENPAKWQALEATAAQKQMIDRTTGSNGLLEGLPVDHVLSVPVEIKGRQAGVLILIRKGEPYRTGDLRLANVFAEQLAHVLANAEAYHAAEESYRSTLLTLVNLVDGRIPETQGHSARVTRLAVMTGEAMGLSGPELDALRWAALLHDVGMCSIGEGVLATRGKLTDEEIVRVRQHPHLGALMCNPIQTPQAVSPAVRSHHERWDGRGYPDGLSGEQIPLHGRIIALAEVFNAHITSRGYRPAKSLSEAIELIKIESGQAFDPGVVEKFLQVIPREAEKLNAPPDEQLTSSVFSGENNVRG